jgi:fatty-acyl-CoA synthase
MLGLMQDRPLLISQIIDFAATYYPDVEIVSRTVEGPIHRYGYRDAAKRAKQLAEALQGLGIKLGDRVGTIAWNTYRHFELYFGISGIGAVLHTLNPRPISPTMPRTRSSLSTSTWCRSSKACGTSSRR